MNGFIIKTILLVIVQLAFKACIVFFGLESSIIMLFIVMHYLFRLIDEMQENDTI